MVSAKPASAPEVNQLKRQTVDGNVCDDGIRTISAFCGDECLGSSVAMLPVVGRSSGRGSCQPFLKLQNCPVFGSVTVHPVLNGYGSGVSPYF